MLTPTSPSLTTVQIIEDAIDLGTLTLTTPPPSPQPTIPLPTFPLTLIIPLEEEPSIHIDNHNPSPQALRQSLPDDTLDSPIDYEAMEEDKENDDPNDPELPFFPNNPTSSQFHPLYIQLENPSPDSPA